VGRMKRGLSHNSQKLRQRHSTSSGRLSRKVFLVLTLGLSISSGAAGLAAWTRTAPLFKLSTIDVGGNRLIPSRLALEMVPVRRGTNIFAVDLDAIERALKQDPRIREVTIRRELPSKIIITIREREPIMLLSANQLYGVDQEGTVIPLSQEAGLQDLPVLTGVFPEVQPGAGYEYLGVQKGLEIRQAIAQVAPSLLDKVSEINVARPEAPIIYFVRGAGMVRLGCGDLRVKLRRLWAVLGDLATKGIKVKSLDLRFKNQVICQPAS
jgi:cell division protein FtsQ